MEKEERIAFLEGQVQELKQQIRRQEEENNRLRLIVKQKNEYIIQAQTLVNHYATGKLMQLNHFMFRLKGQYLGGQKEDKAEFRSWLKGRRKKTNKTIGEGSRYNPWMVVDGKLQEALCCNGGIAAGSGTEAGAEEKMSGEAKEGGSAAAVEMLMLPDGIRQKLEENYTKYDVIIFSVIDYDFRHQRPQHFADRFAGNGHRVFYVNANFVRPDSVTEIADGLHVVDFRNEEHNAIYTMQGQDTLEWMKEKLNQLVYTQAVRDAVVVVDYPNWVYGAEYLREQYGFCVVTDYMDDFTGFLGTAEEFLKDNCIRLLKTSDLVVTSSQFLLEVAQKYTAEEKIRVVRNGTEVSHFYQAVNMKREYGERKVIGYYGAVAHWFAWEKVCFLAKNLPDCDVVIIGEVTEHREQLEKYKNIKLLGEMKYTDLPAHLAYFDVCLIPFDTSTDLIKATNPVKFYEYLSAGKKIVATEIPELMPYRDEYVYMSNDDEKFLEYVRLCLEGKDTLKGMEECIKFAGENDWQKRYECFEEACRARVPKVSVIVLTYNNLDYNKACISSILNRTAYPDYELIIVDNLSTDGTREYLKQLQAENHPNVRIVLNEENSGFAGGNNLGMKLAEGDYILLLNNDTVVSRGWMTGMVKHMANSDKLGMCGAVTNSIGNEAMIRVNYQSDSRMQEFAYAYTAEHMGGEYKEADRLAMFCTLIRRSIVEEKGGLDEQYKVGMFEDDDYAQTVRHAGYELVIAEDVFVHHINNASFKKLEDEVYRKIFEENKAKYEKKWNTKWQMPKYRDGVTATCNEGMHI